MFSSNTSQVVATSTQAEAIDFDGTNDYLSRSTDLVGNFNGKTFTFSFWVCNYSGGTGRVYRADGNGSSFFDIYITNSTLVGGLTNTTGSNTLSFTLPWGGTTIINNTWYNIIVSIDLASSANRYVYVNDINVTSSVTWTTYSNTVSAFTQPNHFVAAGSGGGSKLTGRLSNVFLDRTYRDLSVTANRRLFVTADLKPAAGQAALNPILYLPMSDPTTVGTNAGTGGNFTLTGTVARSGRGPNQYNAPYSDLDGTADYLQRISAPTGIADGKTFTLHCAVLPDVLSSSAHYVLSFSSSSDIKFRFYLSSNGAATLNGYTSAGTNVLTISFPSATFVVGRNYVIDVSVDLTDTAKRHVYVNGTSVSVTWSTYIQTSNINFAITTTPKYVVGTDSTYTADYNGKLGALWFNTSYIDLSVASNLAKFVTGTGIDAKPVDLGATGELPTGTSPLIYLPMYGNNAGNNYGTGGNFTAVSAPYTGARGPNEFWGNGVTYSSTGSTLSNTSGDGASSSTFTFSVWLQATGSGATGEATVIAFGPGNSRYIYVYWVDGGGRQMYFNNFWTGGTSAVSANFTVSSTGYTHLLVSKTGNTYQCYVNGVSTAMTVTGTVGNWVDGQKYINFGSDAATQAAVGELFLTTQYFDLSQEANRLIFRDCFGNPTNLPLAITNGTLTNPKYYLRFAPGAFGTNAGTGGNFTTTGTLLDKGQF